MSHVPTSDVCGADFFDRSPRILITRLSAIGDCILTMPLAVALRDAFPQSFIAWAVEGVAGTVVERHAAVDLAIRLPRRFSRSPGALLRLSQRLRSLRFDLAIDPQSLTKSSLVAWLSGTKRRIGFSRPVGREIAPWLNTQLVDCRTRHVVDRYLELLHPLGKSAGPVRFDFPRDEPLEAQIRTALQSSGLHRPFAVLNPGAGWESKRWPAERYAEVARQLHIRWHVATLAVWAGPQERAWADQIAGLAGGAALVAPSTTLLELAAVLRQAALFVGSDTGPLHMAAAVGTPCVGIYGPTRPEDCGPYGPGHQTVQAWYQDGSSRKRRNGANDAMRDVPVEWVVNACGRILEARGAESAA
ncbi:MAG TPA: glycosyltransferase family 9 protein [Pirellulaceae bacterium]|nr:glycosyltransferase family 9 protein [Pirellulaceae bacterium]